MPSRTLAALRKLRMEHIDGQEFIDLRGELEELKPLVQQRKRLVEERERLVEERSPHCPG